MQKAIKNSRIQYDEKGNLVDVRHQRDIEGYAQWQAGNRQLNREYLEYERMKNHYQKIGQKPPYKTLGSFRKARRSDNLSPAFKKWRYRQMDKNTFDRWIKIRNFRNCPQTVEDLQKIKYNKDAEEWVLLKRERKTISEINAKNWTESFYNKAIDTYYKFREKGIEFTDHGVARYLSRMTESEFLSIHKKPFNYIQSDGRLVKYYDNTAIIYDAQTKEVVSIVNDRKKARSDWDEIKNEVDT